MISVVTIIVLLGAVYIRKLISPHTINPYNVKYSSGKYIDGALSARESSILINNINDVINNEKLNELNKLEYFEIKNYILLTENLESLKSGKKINMSNSTLWTPSGKIMELRTTSEKVAKKLMIPKKCSLLQNSGEPVIIDKNCMGDNEFFQFKKKKDFFPGAFLALKYDNELNRLLLFENDEGDSYNNGNRYISLFPTYSDSY